MNDNRCVYCGDIIPEGRMVCPICEHQQIKIGRILQSNKATTEEVKMAYDFITEENIEEKDNGEV